MPEWWCLVTVAGPEAAVRPERVRQPRSDSLRNRARILEAAEEVFGIEGLAVPIDVIAERAGVGVGTIYRHFPTKEALFEAIVLSHFQRFVDDARSCEVDDDAAEALFGFLARLVAEGVDKRDLADALAGAGIDLKEAAGGLKHELEAALEHLLVRAQQAGSIRADISIADLMGLVSGTCMTAERSGAHACSAERMLAVVCDGLRRTD
jgi:AcrR family transcriptional regulator